MIGMRPNHLFPPFNDPRARQALLAMVNQPDYMELASGGDPANTRTCFSFLGCGLPTSSEAGMENFHKQDFERARRLLTEAGYDGRKIVLMQPTDLPLMRDAALLAAQVLRQGGLNLDVQPMDWATLVQRRAKQDPPAAGGWDLHHLHPRNAVALADREPVYGFALWRKGLVRQAVRSEIECAARRLGDGDRPDEKYGHLPWDSAAGGADGPVRSPR
jgi:ABC-type transport system substrate-binding protein